MSPEQKDRLGNWLALVVVILSILLLIGTASASVVLVWAIIILNFIFGPACLFFYLLEVRKGIFSKDSTD